MCPYGRQSLSYGCYEVTCGRYWCPHGSFGHLFRVLNHPYGGLHTFLVAFVMLSQLYVSFVRRRRKLANYKSWDKYLWDDYVFRSRTVKTFNRRHAPLSRGVKGAFGDLLQDPVSWDTADTEAANAGESRNVRPDDDDRGDSSVTDAMSLAAQRITEEWDSDTEEWVSRC